ncbi:hypothetical protein G7Y89_g8837 [Cudoniella acicularis]|uniref:Uncharacterized protein n=1 Tax=Cudoniella acicularis TaxID=354080 RepID=A0A8H4W0Q2_9HELO|nr:hypothetical protein G7Y89_g8837 [Cudoniella acicularis]
MSALSGIDLAAQILSAATPGSTKAAVQQKPPIVDFKHQRKANGDPREIDFPQNVRWQDSQRYKPKPLWHEHNKSTYQTLQASPKLQLIISSHRRLQESGCPNTYLIFAYFSINIFVTRLSSAFSGSLRFLLIRFLKCLKVQCYAYSVDLVHLFLRLSVSRADDADFGTSKSKSYIIVVLNFGNSGVEIVLRDQVANGIVDGCGVTAND